MCKIFKGYLNNNRLLKKGLYHVIPWSRPISESSDSLSPDVVMPTAPVTELEARYKTEINIIFRKHKLTQNNGISTKSTWTWNGSQFKMSASL